MGREKHGTPKKDSRRDRRSRSPADEDASQFDLATMRSILGDERKAFLESIKGHVAPLAESIESLRSAHEQLARDLAAIRQRVDGLERSPSRARSLDPPPAKAMRVSFERSASEPPTLRSLPAHIYDTILVISNMSLDDAANKKFVEELSVQHALRSGKCVVLGKYKGLVQIEVEQHDHARRFDETWRAQRPTVPSCTNTLYVSYKVSRERARDEFIYRVFGRWLTSKGQELDKHRATLSYYKDQKQLARIQDASLLEGPAWPSSWKPAEFASFLREQEKGKPEAKHRL